MEPELARFESEAKSKLNIVNINVDSEKAKLESYPEVAKELQSAGSIPRTWVVDAQGKILWVQGGAMKESQLREALKAYL